MALLLPRRKAGAVDISTVFSTDLYTGNGSTQTITNGIDLSGEGGLVWSKDRSTAIGHFLFDTARGQSKRLSTHNTTAEATMSPTDGVLASFNSDGHSIAVSGGTAINNSGTTYAAWTFRKSPSFFDVVTYTGDGVDGRTVSHNLGVAPGMIVVKCTSDASTQWQVYHRSNTANPETDALYLNLTDATADDASFWWDTAPTSTEFTLGANGSNNGLGRTYVAYLFAHDTTDNGVIQCGSYTGNGSTTGPTVTLGWEPQWVMIKRATGGTASWFLIDNERSTANPRRLSLWPNSLVAEQTGDDVDFLSTGFQMKTASAINNASGSEFIYVAIRAEGV